MEWFLFLAILAGAVVLIYLLCEGLRLLNTPERMIQIFAVVLASMSGVILATRFLP